MNGEKEDDIDVLLREQFEGPVPDDGFCDRTMEQLAARPRRSSRRFAHQPRPFWKENGLRSAFLRLRRPSRGASRAKPERICLTCGDSPLISRECRRQAGAGRAPPRRALLACRRPDSRRLGGRTRRREPDRSSNLALDLLERIADSAANDSLLVCIT